MSLPPDTSPVRGSEPAPQISLTRVVVVADPDGLHLRKCMAVVQAVQRHQIPVTIRSPGHVEDAASILGLMSLAAPKGTELILSATGPTAKEALEAVAGVLADQAWVGSADE